MINVEPVTRDLVQSFMSSSLNSLVEGKTKAKCKEFQYLLKMNEEASLSKENLIIRIKHENEVLT